LAFISRQMWKKINFSMDSLIYFARRYSCAEMMVRFRVTRWVCGKIAQNVAKHIFIKIYAWLEPKKNVAQRFGLLLLFSWNCQNYTMTQWAKIRPIWGRCYDRNFLRFLQFSAKKLAFFSKTNVMIIFFEKSSFILSQKLQYFRRSFGENIF
jgi:hypothetical protein